MNHPAQHRQTSALPLAPFVRRWSMPRWFRGLEVLLGLLVWCGGNTQTLPQSDPPFSPEESSPVALAVTPDGKRLWIACATEPQLVAVDSPDGRIARRIRIPATPSGLALSPDGTHLYVTCAAASSTVCVIEEATGQTTRQFPAGHTATAPVLGLDGHTLYVCNRFDHDVSFIPLPDGGHSRRVHVRREPIAAALTPDGRHLLVANHLPSGRADVHSVAASVSVIDTTTAQLVQEIPLPDGSGLLRGLCVSPDGRYACVTHILARYHFLPRMVYLGWINQNAISLIDLHSWAHLATVALDESSRGAGNPWAVAWTADGRFLCVTHAGKHDLSCLDAPALLDRLLELPPRFGSPRTPSEERSLPYRMPRYGPARSREEVPYDFAFLSQLRQRLPSAGYGPRAIAVRHDMAYVANWFSDSVSLVPLAGQTSQVATVSLSPTNRTPTAARLGERFFNDATLCRQGWQSCASCHDADARADALNWDLLNDGAHNPKNTRSLLLSPQTPPMMSLGVRDSAATAARAGLQHILFTRPSPEIAPAIDAYLESLHPVPSPRLVGGRLSAAAARGQALFQRAQVGCINCHPPPLFTDLAAHTVGTAGDYDHASDQFDTPTLVELWRTAPYLHNGSAATVHDVLRARNPNDEHGHTAHLSPQEIDDLVEYLLSL